MKYLEITPEMERDAVDIANNPLLGPATPATALRRFFRAIVAQSQAPQEQAPSGELPKPEPPRCVKCGKVAMPGWRHVCPQPAPPNQVLGLAGMRDLRDGWDSYGGKKPTEAAIRAVEKMQACPMSDGGIQLDWDDETVEIGPDGKVRGSYPGEQPAPPAKPELARDQDGDVTTRRRRRVLPGCARSSPEVWRRS